MRGSVQSCARRRDDKWLVVIGKPGGIQVTGVSETEIPAGRDAVIEDGKARPAR